MAWGCSGRTNKELVDNLVKNGLIKSSIVKTAMETVDRAHYCLSPGYAYEDSPQSIGHAATISAPHMHASAAESLLPFLHPNARVLDIGSGSGYLTAVLAEVLNTNTQSTDSRNPTNPEVTAGGKVVGLEHIQALRDLGENNMGKSERGREMLRSGKVKFVVGDGRKGWLGDGGKEEGWDAIHVGAAAAAIHPELLEQLRSPGRMFIPVEDSHGSQWIWVVDKDEKGQVKKQKTMGVRYVPLTDAPK